MISFTDATFTTHLNLVVFCYVFKELLVIVHLMTKAEFSICEPIFLIFADLGKTFQNRRVSSPAPVTMDSPSGLIARYNTRRLCPVKVDSLRIEGYFQTTMALSE